MDGKQLIEKLLAYAKAHLCLREEDEVYMRNVLLSQFGFTEPYEGKADVSAEEQADVPDALAEELNAFAVEQGFVRRISRNATLRTCSACSRPFPRRSTAHSAKSGRERARRRRATISIIFPSKTGMCRRRRSPAI